MVVKVCKLRDKSRFSKLKERHKYKFSTKNAQLAFLIFIDLQTYQKYKTKIIDT